MPVRCEICSPLLGIRCIADTFSENPRQIVTTTRGVAMTSFDQSILDCEIDSVLPEADEFLDGLTGDPKLTMKTLLPLLEAFESAGILKQKEVEIVTHNFGGFSVRVIIDALLLAVKRAEQGLLFTPKQSAELKCKQSVSRIKSLLFDPNLNWLIDQHTPIEVVKQNTPEDSFGGDMQASLSADFRRLLQYPSGNLRVQSKSSQHHVDTFLTTLASKCGKTKNSCYLERDPNKQPLVVLCGQNDTPLISAHLAYQLAAQVVNKNFHSPESALDDMFQLVPPAVLALMYRMLLDYDQSADHPAFISEMNVLFAILDGFSTKPAAGTKQKKKFKTVLDGRTKLILDKVVHIGTLA